MSEPSADFNPRRFRTTVPYYARYRLPYPELLIRRAIERAGLAPGDSVMDLGCGPGLLAIPFARAGMKVTAIDPEPEMLAEARTAAKEAGVAIDIRQGSSFELPPGIGPFKLVTMGRAFHWMDRKATLKTLDRLVTADGAIGFFDDDHPDTMENAWRRALRDIGNRYGREDTAHLRGKKRADYRCRESLLLDSAFSLIEACVVYVKRQITVEEVLGLAFSLSTSSPEALGERLPEFERELRAELDRLSPEGTFTEIAQLEAQIAKRV